MITKKLAASVKMFSNRECSRCSVAKMQVKEFKTSASWLKTVILNILNYFHIYVLHIYTYVWGLTVVQLVEALCNKPEVCRFDS